MAKFAPDGSDLVLDSRCGAGHFIFLAEEGALVALLPVVARVPPAECLGCPADPEVPTQVVALRITAPG